jgi:putative transposase
MKPGRGALALQNENYRNGGKFIGKFSMKKRFTEWRNSAETPWLADAPRHPVDEAILDLDRAFANFFAKRAEFPCFKRKGQCADSFRFPDPKQIKLDRENGRISLPKLGYMRYRNSRTPIGDVRNVTVSSKGGKWFVSILTRREVEQPVPRGLAVGIDMGIARFAALSDGSHVEPLNSFKKHEQRLAKYQRRMSRKTKFSSNWKKAKARVQKMHTGIANARNDFLHKTSTTISKNHALVCIEDLRIGNMSKSSAGTLEAPGRKVSQKSGLNRAIPDQGWFEFRRQIGYKTAMGRRLHGRGPCGLYESDVPVLRPCSEGKPQDAGVVRVCALRPYGQRRSRRCDQCFRAWAALVCLWRDGAVGPPVEAGTRRGDPGCIGLSAAGITVLQGGEDVN